MPWNSQGGGSNGGPWRPQGGNQNPWGKGGPTPDLDELFRKSQEKLKKAFPGGFGGGRGAALVVMAALLLWGITGIYKVNPDEVGVVLRFGRFIGYTQPGLNYHLPSPIETVIKAPVTRINKMELGYRSGSSENRRVGFRDAGDESLMLTGDENIVDINFSVFWKISDPEKFLFNVRDPEGTVQMVAQSAMREIIGQLPIRAPLFENRQAIGDRTRARMQELLDAYQTGVSVLQVQLLKADPPAEVIDAFNDVQRAKADQERLSNEADAYRNNMIPVAKGEAQKTIQEAEAYRQQVVDLAQGETQRFTSVAQAYRLAPDLTAKRMYIETMESVLQHSQKVIIDPQAKGVIPYLPLPALKASEETPKTKGEK